MPSLIPEILTAKRYMDPAAQEELLDAVRKEVRLKPSYSAFDILRRRQAAATLVAERIYGIALHDPEGSLQDLPTDESKAILQGAIDQSPTASDWATTTTIITDPRPNGRKDVIAYKLISSVLSDEKEALNAAVVEMNGGLAARLNLANIYLAVAVTKQGDPNTSRLAKAFETVRPEIIRFMPAVVMTATEARAYRSESPELQPADLQA